MEVTYKKYSICWNGCPLFKLRENMMPAALVELGFIDSADVRLLKEHQEDMARAVARGVTDYWRML